MSYLTRGTKERRGVALMHLLLCTCSYALVVIRTVLHSIAQCPQGLDIAYVSCGS